MWNCGADCCGGPRHLCYRPHVARARAIGPARPRHGSHAAKTGRCSPLRAYGRPGAACAGRRARWSGEHELFGFLTTEPNAIVAPIHSKAMPVILTTTEEFDLWLEGETVEALKLQRPLPDGMLSIVARGEKEDGAVGAELFDRWREPATKRNGPAPDREINRHGALSGKGQTAANPAAFPKSSRPLNHAGRQGGQLARFVEARDWEPDQTRTHVIPPDQIAGIQASGDVGCRACSAPSQLS
jgi:hypothetical protein